uniref:Reverse transcriptase domain-containing protein n=1 Tax=Chelydra serpentina TaxID=8475 RepID=A0A8C3S7B0_CHESE
MRKYNVGRKLILTIKHLYAKASSAVLVNCTIGEWFLTTACGFPPQGCLLSLTLFNIYLERIMTDALEDHICTVSIGGRTISNLRFADDIDGLAGREDELANLVKQLDETCTKYGMEISAEKTKLMANKHDGISSHITVSGQELKTVKQFKHLGAIITDEGSKAEIWARTAQTTAAVATLKPVWRDKNISLESKLKLLHALVISIFLYAGKTWTLTAELNGKYR